MTPAHAILASAVGSTYVIPPPRYHTADILLVGFAVAMALVLAVIIFVSAHNSHQRDRDWARTGLI
ncbi:hypothetical protein [Streptomyces sioyaensis]|uniref:hypothetical protein n=1 Tax=Streptomyces sioyaensis TaxID=67364 RepID=UPI0037918408